MQQQPILLHDRQVSCVFYLTWFLYIIEIFSKKCAPFFIQNFIRYTHLHSHVWEKRKFTLISIIQRKHEIELTLELLDLEDEWNGILRENLFFNFYFSTLIMTDINFFWKSIYNVVINCLGQVFSLSLFTRGKPL